MFPKFISQMSAPWCFVILGYLTASIAASSLEKLPGPVEELKYSKNSNDSSNLRQSKEYNGSPPYAKRSAAQALVKRAVGAVPVSGVPSGQVPCAVPAIAKRAVGSVPDPAQLCGRTAPTIHARSELHVRSVATPELKPAEVVISSLGQLSPRASRSSGKPVDAKKWASARAWKRE